MPPTIIAKKADNWVDRGEPAEPKLALVLAHVFNKHDALDRSWLLEHASTVLGMVAAGATDHHVMGYLRSVWRTLSDEPATPPGTRMGAVALWHVAKAALVRDFAERVLQGEVPPNVPTAEPLSQWLASRLLTPEEMAEFEADKGPD
jgi:hypothetical protein